MIEKTYTIINRLGLDYRECTIFASTIARFQSALVVKTGTGETTATGKDAMGLMMLAADHGSQLKIAATGPDEKLVFDALEKQFAGWFWTPDAVPVAAKPRLPLQEWEVQIRSPKDVAHSLESTGTNLIDPASPPDPLVLTCKDEWEKALACLPHAKISVADLERLVERFAKPRLQAAERRVAPAALVSARGAAVSDFRGSVDAWIAALKQSEPLRKSRRAREELLKQLVADQVKSRLGPLPPAKTKVRRTIRKAKFKPGARKSRGRKTGAATRFVLQVDQSSKKTILLDAKTGETWMLEENR